MFPNRVFKFTLILLLAAGLVAGLGNPLPAAAKATVIHTVEKYPEDFRTSIIPCVGEMIHFTGITTIVASTVFNPKGGYHTHFLINRKVSGFSEISGREFIGHWNIKGTFNSQAGPPPYEQFNSYIEQTRFINPGNGIEFIGHTTAHLTVNGKGEVEVNFDKTWFECK